MGVSEIFNVAVADFDIVIVMEGKGDFVNVVDGKGEDLDVEVWLVMIIGENGGKLQLKENNRIITKTYLFIKHSIPIQINNYDSSFFIVCSCGN